LDQGHTRQRNKGNERRLSTIGGVRHTTYEIRVRQHTRRTVAGRHSKNGLDAWVRLKRISG